VSLTVGIAAGCGSTEAAPPEQTREETSAATAAVTAPRRTQLSFTAADGTTIEYVLVAPAGFRRGGTSPVLLALPPGEQGQEEVDAVLGAYWEGEALARGWVVVSPLAPGGELYFQGAERYLPELLEEVRGLVQPEGGAFHLAGISNGGVSAFRIALDHPELFRSLLVLPGFPPSAEDFDRLDELAGIPVALYVGEYDEDWREEAERTTDELERLGGEVTLVISPDEGHILRKVTGSELYDFLDGAR
jgi:dipeptidyl aminopeptidase/acylaminoacyl peptidase